MNKTRGYTKIYFGENQLSPGSIGILPLTTSHPMPFHRQRVRASTPLSRGFTLSWLAHLVSGRSEISKSPFKTCFRYAFPQKVVKHAISGHSLTHSSIGTTSSS